MIVSDCNSIIELGDHTPNQQKPDEASGDHSQSNLLTTMLEFISEFWIFSLFRGV